MGDAWASTLWKKFNCLINHPWLHRTLINRSRSETQKKQYFNILLTSSVVSAITRSTSSLKHIITFSHMMTAMNMTLVTPSCVRCCVTCCLHPALLGLSRNNSVTSPWRQGRLKCILKLNWTNFPTLANHSTSDIVQEDWSFPSNRTATCVVAVLPHQVTRSSGTYISFKVSRISICNSVNLSTKAIRNKHKIMGKNKVRISDEIKYCSLFWKKTYIL